MKRPFDALRAFHHACTTGMPARLWIAGGGDETPLRQYVEKHALLDRVVFHGRTSEARKLDLMQRASVLVATSVKEGWGLIVTEANSMGTPAIVYNVDGLRSAAGEHNWISVPTPDALATRLAAAARVFAQRDAYDDWGRSVLEASRRYTHDASYDDFRRALMTCRAESSR